MSKKPRVRKFPRHWKGPNPAGWYKRATNLRHEHEGFFFSKNGHKAYLRGERPEFLWPNGANIIPTVPHHISRQLKDGRGYTHELVMFYKEPPKQKE